MIARDGQILRTRAIHRFEQRLQLAAPICLDGGLATEIEGGGHTLDGKLWSAGLLLTDRPAIAAAHGRFAAAGADILATASYQGSREGFMRQGLSGREADRLLAGSVALARDAARSAGATDTLIAASLGPWGAAQADGSEYTGSYQVDDHALRRFHRERLAVMDRSGADVLALETIPNQQEAEVLVKALAEVDTPAWVSFCCRDDKQLSDGTPIETAGRLFRDHPRVLAIGVNCTAPANVSGLIARINGAVPAMPCFVYPNSGEQYDADRRRWQGDSSVDAAGEAALAWIAEGARGVGGCCRVSARHIQAMAAAIHNSGVETP